MGTSEGPWKMVIEELEEPAGKPSRETSQGGKSINFFSPRT